MKKYSLLLFTMSFFFSDKLSSLLDASKATRLSDKIFELLEHVKSTTQKEKETVKSKKRHIEPENHTAKKSKFEENGVVPSKEPTTKTNNKETPSKEELSATQVG